RAGGRRGDERHHRVRWRGTDSSAVGGLRCWHPFLVAGSPWSDSGLQGFRSPLEPDRIVAEMKPRTASRLAWSIGTASIVLLVGGLVVMFIDRPAAVPAAASSAQWNFSNVLSYLANIAGVAIGIVLASKRPQNRIGWLFLAAGSMLGVSGFGTPYGVHALVVDPGSLPAGPAVAWLGNWVGF